MGNILLHHEGSIRLPVYSQLKKNRFFSLIICSDIFPGLMLRLYRGNCINPNFFFKSSTLQPRSLFNVQKFYLCHFFRYFSNNDDVYKYPKKIFLLKIIRKKIFSDKFDIISFQNIQKDFFSYIFRSSSDTRCVIIFYKIKIRYVFFITLRFYFFFVWYIHVLYHYKSIINNL